MRENVKMSMNASGHVKLLIRSFAPKMLWVAALVLVLLPAAAAQAQSPLNISVTAGFDGYAKQNVWMPITVHAENNGSPLAGEIRARANYPGESYAASLNLPAQSQKTVTILVPYRGDYTVQFVTDDGQTQFKKVVNPRALAPYDYFVGVVADNRDVLNFLAGLQTPATGGPVSVAHLRITDLPAQVGGLAAFDVLIFNGVDTGALSAGQLAALSDWVVGGGKLVVGGGPNAGLTVNGLQSLLPASNFVLKTVPALDNLQNLGGRPISNEGPFSAAVPQSVGGTIDLYEQDMPFLVRQSLGEGQVIYFALDFSLAPMDGWAGNENFWRHILAPLASHPPFYVGYEAPRAINDYLAAINGSGLPSPVFFTGFLCLYFLFLVPLNYWALKRLKRREWAWLTIPALIVLFTLAGYVGGFRSRGKNSILRQLSVVWQQSGASVAQETAYLGLYAPVRDHFDIVFDDVALVQPSEGGNGYRGVKANVSAPTTIFYGARTELRNLWTDIGSMSTIVALRRTTVQPIDLQLTLGGTSSSPSLSGTIVNHTPHTFTATVLFVGSNGVKLGLLPPGETRVDQSLQRLDTQPYNGTDLWGTPYSRLNSPLQQTRDQVVRGLFWNNQFAAPYPQAVQPAQVQPNDVIFLVGWLDAAPSDWISVAHKRVTHQPAQIRVVAALPAGGGK